MSKADMVVMGHNSPRPPLLCQCPVSSVLQIQTLWLTFRLRLHHPLSCRPKVCHLNSHSSLTECHQSRLGAYSLDIGTREIVLLIDKFVEVHVIVERHFRGVEGENLALGVFWVTR